MLFTVIVRHNIASS